MINEKSQRLASRSRKPNTSNDDNSPHNITAVRSGFHMTSCAKSDLIKICAHYIVYIVTEAKGEGGAR
jgi:hypothetical protein